MYWILKLEVQGERAQAWPSPEAQRMLPGGCPPLVVWPSSGCTFPRWVAQMVPTAPALVGSEHL